MTCVNHHNHSKNDGSTDDSMHKIIIAVCGLANLRCFGGWGGGCCLDCACGKYERNGFERVYSRPQGPSVFLSGPRKPTDGVALVTRMADV